MNCVIILCYYIANGRPAPAPASHSVLQYLLTLTRKTILTSQTMGTNNLKHFADICI